MGTVTVALYTVVDLTGSITVNGASVPVSLPTPGQNARLTFAGTGGQVVSASATNATFQGCAAFTLLILKPDGSTLASASSCNASASLPNKTLPTSGTYTIKVDPAGATTGTATLTLTSP